MLKQCTSSLLASFRGQIVLLGVGLFLIAGCSTVNTPLEKPSVNVTSVRLLSVQGFSPEFEIGLRVVNPNAVQLRLRGMRYTLSLNDYDVIEGAANDLPVVPAYGEAKVNVTANVGLIEGMRFVNDMMKNAGAPIAYKVEANLDVGTMYPMLKVEKSGSFSPMQTQPGTTEPKP